jgi:hypothetical protein
MDGQGDRPMDKPTLERHPRGCSCVGSVQHSGAKSCTPLFVQMLIASTREPFISVGAILSPRVRVQPLLVPGTKSADSMASMLWCLCVLVSKLESLGIVAGEGCGVNRLGMSV